MILTQDSTRLVGYVRSRNGPLGGAKVICNGEETITLFDGSYEFSNLKPKMYEVTANLRGFQSQTRKIEIHGGSTVHLDFQLQESVGTARIFGYVYDYETKRPAFSNGSMILILPVANLYAHIDKNGYFEFTCLSAGEYEIIVSIAGYEEVKTVVSVEEGKQVRKDFYCKPMKIEEPPWG